MTEIGEAGAKPARSRHRIGNSRSRKTVLSYRQRDSTSDGAAGMYVVNAECS